MSTPQVAVPPSKGVARVGRRGALGVVAAAALAGCSFLSNEFEDDPDLSGLDEAVEAASARVSAVQESERVVDGLGHPLVMTLRLDTDVPPTAEELDLIVEAIWQHVPWEPSGIDLVVGAVDTGDVPVDLETAAAGLDPMTSRPFGQGGVSLGRMRDRYGEWQDPE